MAKKCKYCFMPIETSSTVCGVCKIDSTKEKRLLSKEEKKVAYYCRAIYISGFFAALGGILGILGSVGTFAKGSLSVSSFMLILINLILAIAFLIFGLEVRKFKPWCYAGGIVLWTIAIIMGLLSKALPTIVFAILFLSYTAAPTAKKIFYRQI